MRHLIFRVVFVVVTSGVRCVFGGEKPPEQSLVLQLDLVDGSRVIGTPGIEALPFQTTYAKMSVPLKQIRAIEMDANHEIASVDLLNGDRIQGKVDFKPFDLATVFGQAVISVEHIRSLRVSIRGMAFARKGMVLWNRFDSESDVAQSAVGPGGKFTSGRFVEGRFGKGVELNMQEQFGVTFPAELISGLDGCIEFWAKLVDFPGDIRQPGGAWPSLIAASDEKGSPCFLMHFCANDGGSAGGLCFQGAGNGGTGGVGAWSYANAIGGGAADAWHHYALVWAADGIPGVDNGKRKEAVFVDGKLNTGFWNGEGGRMAVSKTWRFGLLAHHGTQGCRIVYDNMKIWNYSKTDFSDRNEE